MIALVFALCLLGFAGIGLALRELFRRQNAFNALLGVALGKLEAGQMKATEGQEARSLLEIGEIRGLRQDVAGVTAALTTARREGVEILDNSRATAKGLKDWAELVAKDREEKLEKEVEEAKVVRTPIFGQPRVAAFRGQLQRLEEDSRRAAEAGEQGEE